MKPGAKAGEGRPARSERPRAEAVGGAPPPVGLYVHFPFCTHACHYCDYAVRASARPPVGAWLRAVERETKGWFRDTGWSPGLPLRTLYIGGGTPSLLGGDGVEELRAVLGRFFRLDGLEEWTAEANPDSLDPATARRWREAGVSRVSLGVQSFQPEPLGWLGRLHGPASAHRSVERALEAGFPHVNLDLLFALPGEVERDWEADLERAAGSGADHVTLYGLATDASTPFGQWAEAGLVRPADDEAFAGEYLQASRRLTSRGFAHYEVTHLARPGGRSAHGRASWSGAPRLGIGPSAHGHLPPCTLRNERGWEAYRQAVRDRGGATTVVERSDGETDPAHLLWGRLRQRRGIPGDTRLAERVTRSAAPLLDSWESAGWVTREDGGIALTPRGWLRIDRCAAALAARLQDAGEPGFDGETA